MPTDCARSCQVLLPLMQSDLYEVMKNCVEGRLGEKSVTFTPGAAAATVVLAAEGYPGKYPKGMPISGLEDAAKVPGVTVYHAGTKLVPPASSEAVPVATGSQEEVSSSFSGDRLVTSGGRVLAVTGTGSSFVEALNAAYCGTSLVKFTPCHFRKDIGHRARTAPLKIGVLASGRGTALQAVIDAAEAGEVNASVVLILTNRKEAPVRERAKQHGIREMFINAKVRVRCLS